jgi:RNA polymerase sigma-70 factor (ECF subfamily)
MTTPAIPFDTTLADARDASPEMDRDSDVLDLVLRGEMEVALCCLMQRYGRAIYRYCCEQLRDPALAEDVQQQVFIAAFRDLAKFRGSGTLRAWLFRIAYHRVIDAARVRARSPAGVSVGEAAEVADPRAPADEACDDERLRAALVAELAELPEHLRCAILLRFQQGMSFEEIARILGEKPGTLSARVLRAMPVLRERIEARLRRPADRPRSGPPVGVEPGPAAGGM